VEFAVVSIPDYNILAWILPAIPANTVSVLFTGWSWRLLFFRLDRLRFWRLTVLSMNEEAAEMRKHSFTLSELVATPQS
jgi:hypothetical protein